MRGRSPSLPASRPPAGSKSGQALLESFGIILLLCMILFGMVQYVLMLTATEVVQYSADASVRGRAVGFHRNFVRRISRVAAIPNAGNMTTPNPVFAGSNWSSETVGEMWERQPGGLGGEIWRNPTSSQYALEYDLIPEYLAAGSSRTAGAYLDYQDWDSVSYPIYTVTGSGMLEVTIRQDYPLRMPLFRAFSENDSIRISRNSQLADHAELYLE